jgi:serine/threonine protein kinase
MDEQDLLNVLPPGTRLHSNEVVRILGKGGFGITYLAQHMIFTERRSAIKEYFPVELAFREGGELRAKSSQHQRLFESGKERFLEEARTLARFQHPNIVQVADFFAANGTAYLVMVYEEGNPLSEVYHRAWRQDQGPDEAALLAVALPLLDGLAALHHGGIIHRDIKPSNIFLRQSDESPVLLDFGAARHALGVQTKTLTAYLTPGYAPFEQYYSKSDSQGPWSDIYAMGAVLYHGVSGKPPAESTLRSSAMLRGEMDPMVSALELGQGRYSEGFLAAIDWSLALLERQRPQECDEFAAALRGYRFISEGATESRGSAVPVAHSTLVQSPPSRPAASTVGKTPSRLVVAITPLPASRRADSPSPGSGEGIDGGGNVHSEALPPTPQPSSLQEERARKRTPGTEVMPPPARKLALGVLLGGVIAIVVMGGGGLAWWVLHTEAQAKAEVAAARAEAQVAAAKAKAELATARVAAAKAEAEAETAKKEAAQTKAGVAAADAVRVEMDEARKAEAEAKVKAEAEAKANEQKEADENNKPFWERGTVFSKDAGYGIIVFTTMSLCQDATLVRRGYQYYSYSTIPLARLKQQSDAYNISPGRATTVIGCWSPNLRKAYWHRKKDGQEWGEDLQLDGWVIVQ